MSSLGELHFSLGLDDEKFDKALEAAKQKVEKLGGNVNIGVNFDKEQVAKQLQSLLDPNRKVKLEADISNIEENIRVAKKELEELTKTCSFDTSGIASKQGFIANQTAQLEKARKELESISSLVEPIVLKSELDQECLNRVKAQLDALGTPITAKVNLEFNAEKFDLETFSELRKQLEELSKIQENVLNSVKNSPKKTTSSVESETNKELAQLRRLEEGIRRWENVRANIESSSADKSGLGYQKAIALIDDYIAKLEEAKKRAGEFTDREITSMLGQSMSGKIQEVNRFIKSQKAADKEVARDLANQLAQYQRIEQAIKKLQYLKVDLDTSEIDKDSNSFKKAEKALDDYINKLQKLLAVAGKIDKKDLTDALGVDFSRVMEGVRRVTHGQAWFGEELENTKSKAQALGEVFGQVFNYYMIERFIRNLYTIGGEFQKQQIALQAMIGDVNKANAIFERTKEMAVVSPFTFSELASYTKQMSAYGIEYEELYDTTKRLADISAGVGVDMGRLILAFGQVRSAAVLRGQELRQFTEAGIPMVNELAKAFSELEKKEVKAADVFDKISRREVSFGMVKDVLFDMTDPGGRFYEMQEELAKSLAGQWSNLKDAWEIMIAEIANSTNGPLNSLASLMRTIVSGWRTWLPLISGAAVGITALNAGLRLTNTLVAVGYAGAAAFNPWIAALSAVAALGAGVFAYVSSIETAEEAQARLTAEMEASLSAMEENEKKANRYLDILSKTTDKESEKDELLRRQKLTLETLRSMYGDIVKSTKLEELTAEKIFEWRQKIAEVTGKQSGELLNKNVSDAYSNLLKAQAVLKERETGKKTTLSTNLAGELIKKDVPYTAKEIEEARQSVMAFEDVYEDAIKRRNEWNDKQENLAQEDLSGWRQKAEELIKGTTLQAPKEDQSMREYFNYLKEEYDDGKKEFEMYAADNPITADNRKAAKALRDAANKVNIGLGGRSFDYKQENKDAKNQAKYDADAYLNGLKERLKEIGSKWNMFKEIMDATGDRSLALNLSGLGNVGFKDQLEHLRSEMTDELKKLNINVSAADILGVDFNKVAEIVGDKDKLKRIKEIYDEFHNANRSLRTETIKDFVEIIKASRDFEAQITEVERKLQEDLEKLRQGAKEGKMDTDSEEYKRAEQKLRDEAEEEKAKIRFEEFKKSSDWVKVFDDLDRVSNDTLDNMISKIEEFAKQANLSEEVTKQLVEAMAKLRKESIERNPLEGFKNAWEYRKILTNAIEYTQNGKKRYRVYNGDSVEDLSEEEMNQRLAETNKDLEESALAVADKFKAVSDATDLLSNLFKGLGVDVSGLSDMLNGIASGAQTGASVAGAFGYTGPWGAIIGAAVGLLSSVFSMHDKALQKEIEASEARVRMIESIADNLENRLSSSEGGIYSIGIDDATKKVFTDFIEGFYGWQEYKGLSPRAAKYREYQKYGYLSKDTIDAMQGAIDENSYYKAQLASLKLQRDELEKQKAELEDDKSPDKTKIQDKISEIEALEYELDTFAKSMMETLYGIDFKDWASQFTDSIVNAWSKGEDAAEAYKQTVSDVMRNVAASVIQQRIIGKWLEDNMDKVLALFKDSGGIVTDEVFSALAEIASGIGGKLDETTDFLDAWEKALNEYGMSMKGLSDTSSSSSLSKGIQSITEETANLLGSYINSIRHDSSIQRTLIEQLVSVDVPQMSIIAQAQLQQLQQVAANTKRNADVAESIREALNSVISIGKNGKAIKIV